MRCYICDADSETIPHDYDGFGPCSECQTVIQECIDGYPKIKDTDDIDNDLIDDTLDDTDFFFMIDEDNDDYEPED